MNIKIKNTIIFGIILLQVGFLYSEEKLGQSGFQFLSVVPEARSAGLAGAMTTLSQYSSAVWDNPATMAGLDFKYDVVLNMNEWIADINQNAFSLAVQPGIGDWGVFAISFLYVDYGIVEGTIRADNEQGYFDLGNLNTSAYSFGFAYARSLTNKFSVGAQVKLVGQNLAPAITSFNDDGSTAQHKEAELSTFAYDFGTTFKTGYKSFVFGMSVRNFSQEIKYVADNFQLPLTFSIGASMDIMDYFPSDYHSLYVSIDAIHPRSHSEQVKIATEYNFQKLFSLRLGYISGADEKNFSFGLGVMFKNAGLDYSYTPYGLFSQVQRFSLKFRM